MGFLADANGVLSSDDSTIVVIVDFQLSWTPFFTESTSPAD